MRESKTPYALEDLRQKGELGYYEAFRAEKEVMHLGASEGHYRVLRVDLSK